GPVHLPPAALHVLLGLAAGAMRQFGHAPGQSDRVGHEWRATGSGGAQCIVRAPRRAGAGVRPPERGRPVPARGAMKTPESLQALIDDGVIDAVLRPLKSGKEASVYVVRAGDEVRCAKVYKDM